MHEELTFRIVFWAILFLIIVPNRLLPALRARKTGRRLMPDGNAVNNEGKAIFILRVVLSLPFLAFLVLYSIYPGFMQILHIPIPTAWRWAGAAIAFLGVAGWIYSQAVLDKYWSPQLQIQRDHKIVTAGPYGVVRHPIYTTMIVWAAGVAVLTASFGFILLALLTVTALMLRVPKEERMMLARFGEDYTEYCKRTGRYLPRFRR